MSGDVDRVSSSSGRNLAVYAPCVLLLLSCLRSGVLRDSCMGYPAFGRSRFGGVRCLCGAISECCVGAWAILGWED